MSVRAGKLPAITVIPQRLVTIHAVVPYKKQLNELKNLTWLDLDQTQVTDASLQELKQFKNLTKLFLTKTKVTIAGVKELRKALPQCEIER